VRVEGCACCHADKEAWHRQGMTGRDDTHSITRGWAVPSWSACAQASETLFHSHVAWQELAFSPARDRRRREGDEREWSATKPCHHSPYAVALVCVCRPTARPEKQQTHGTSARTHTVTSTMPEAARRPPSQDQSVVRSDERGHGGGHHWRLARTLDAKRERGWRWEGEEGALEMNNSRVRKPYLYVWGARSMPLVLAHNVR